VKLALGQVVESVFPPQQAVEVLAQVGAVFFRQQQEQLLFPTDKTLHVF